MSFFDECLMNYYCVKWYKDEIDSSNEDLLYKTKTIFNINIKVKENKGNLFI